MPKATSLSTSSLLTAIAAATLLPISDAWAALSVSDAWLRAMPPTQTMTAGYAAVINNGPSAVTITGASSDIAPMAELHMTMQEGESVRMVALPSIKLAPGERFVFAPGGAHIMLMNIPNMPVAESVVQLCFSLENNETSCADATVQRNAPNNQDRPSHNMQHDHHGHHSDSK
ncbi:copper chaperone PCu(A)C [Flavobacteriaceae bacterium]|nr:copper chaperone PCu(A)C [Flavobacteriaceae bacterium]